MMSNESLSSSGNRRVPRPIICLNIAIEPTGRNRTMLRTVGRSTPVDNNCDVVAITGRSLSVSAKSLRWRLPGGVRAKHARADRVRREEAIFDALGKRVLEQWVAEVLVAVARLVALRRRCHAELRGG